MYLLLIMEIRLSRQLKDNFFVYLKQILKVWIL